MNGERPDVRPLGPDSSEHSLRRGLIETISGFAPATTGTTCDGCNAGIAAGEDVLVHARFSPNAGRWDLVRTLCEDHDAEPSTLGTNAVARCETGEIPGSGDEWLMLLNPEIVALHVDDDAEALDAPG